MLFVIWLITFLSTITEISAITTNSLTLDEKIGQLFVVAAVSNTEINKEFMANEPYKMEPDYIKSLIRNYHVGGVIFLGSGYPQEQINLTKEFQALSTYPLFILQDCEWGPAMRLRNVTPFPKSMALGAVLPEHNQLIYQMGKEIARQCKVLSVHCNLAPVSDVNNNPNNPVINDRSFGENPHTVAAKAKLYMQGMRDSGILCCAKHFPGHGDTAADSHSGLPLINHDRKRLEQIELLPFKELINAGVPCIMTAHIAVPALTGNNLPATISRAVVTDLLRTQLGFNGLILTDGLGMKGITAQFGHGEIAVKSLQAGNDILLCPVDVPAAHAAIKQAVMNGTLSMQELDEHVSRILATKTHLFKNYNVVYESLENAHTQALLQSLYDAALTNISETPLRTLDKNKRCALVQISTLAGYEPCAQELLRTQPLTIFTLLPESTPAEQNAVIRKLQEFDRIFITIHSLTRFVKQQFGITDSLRLLVKQITDLYPNKTCCIIFGNAYSMHKFVLPKECLIAYDNSMYAQKAVARFLTGSLIPTGKLPVHG